MMKNHTLAKSISDVSFFEFKRQLTYKAKFYDNTIIEADRFYPSSKTCSSCGGIKDNLTLKDRVYVCDICGLEIDRDYNASLNLARLATQKIGLVQAEIIMPMDLSVLLDDLVINNLISSKDEAGIQT